MLDQVQGHEREHLERGQDASGLVARGDPVAVAVGGDADVGAQPDHGLTQRPQVVGERLGRPAAEHRVGLRADRRDPDASGAHQVLLRHPDAFQAADWARSRLLL